MLAPIGLTVYSRLDHLQRAVAALQNNRLAQESSLYVFSDAPRDGDEDAVQKVRAYIRSIDGFADVTITERETNSRIANNRSGQRQLLEAYGKMIWMAEDIVTAPGFLEYMNGALDYYRDEERVISVTGYTPPIELPPDYTRDVFFLKRFNAWGFGIWKHKYDRIAAHIDPGECRTQMRDAAFYRELNRSGPDIPHMIDREVRGEIDALDVKIMYQQVLHDWYTAYPRESLVQNIGHDGSGVHCTVTGKFNHDALWAKDSNFSFQGEIRPDERIVLENMKFRQLGCLDAVTERFRRMRRRLA